MTAGVVMICQECRHILSYCRCEVTRPRLEPIGRRTRYRLDVTKLSSSLGSRGTQQGPGPGERRTMRAACQQSTKKAS